MGLARVLKQNPRAIAESLVGEAAPPSCVERVEVAGPGFINFFLSDEWLADELMCAQADDRLGAPLSGAGSTVVLDYSSPNVAKPMHIGHIRSTVIGNALDRMHRFLGYEVISDNHVGDWGTQFGILILGYKHFVDEEALAAAPVEELERIYRESYARAKADEAWMDEARCELVKLQQGDDENVGLWQEFVELSMREFQRIYDRLGVSFDMARGESFYRAKLAGVVERLERDGLVEESEGALVVRHADESMPVSIVRKKDGGFNYTTTDIATVLSRIDEFNPQRIVYVTDERQQLHFRQLFSICERLDVDTTLDHVWFGLMRLPEGTFSTRDGNVIKLELLLDEAVNRAREMVETASPEMDEDQKDKVAEAVGVGAVKYADLSQNLQSLVTFTWDKALSLEGNSAPYLQYAYARIASVRDKYRERFPDSDYKHVPIVIGEEVERRLATRLLRFGDAVERAARTYRPNLLAEYLYDLAQTYSSFYQNVPFLKAEAGVRESRVRLCDVVARTLRTGLDLLGIETPDRI
jgi:arginyl-tRNA synthetase